jgi:hypothetical protein
VDVVAKACALADAMGVSYLTALALVEAGYVHGKGK